MSTENFYAELPMLEKFTDITYGKNFVFVPDDWYAIVTDITMSTKAIEAGKYKNVNLLGACSIIAILNVAQNIEIPFVFGGDGASLLIPPLLKDACERALLATQTLAQQEFQMELRAGIIPVSAIAAGYELKIAKLRISENYSQAILRGGGITYATRLVKDIATTNLYCPKSKESPPSADFSGLECRWKDILSRHGEILSLIVIATAPSETQVDAIYREAIAQIEKIYGREQDLHPAFQQGLHLAFQKEQLLPETRVFTKSGNWLQRQSYMLKIRLENLLGVIFVKFNLKVGGFEWGTYKQIVSEATDYKKFDDGLRMVISGNASQRKKLVIYLDKKFKEGRLVYGYHVSDRALMTCLVFERNGRQVHFIDGADGGYALAAKEMKDRLKS
ncbi:DUF3095 domain-containing protein [Tumidithrix elongata RA019]|uniref:DUF3095 domain-containing protein n=1 Tax=Tumidithrix elongata BACA0141 TaxID=2716417 RepID=A0AAW9PWB0_9CYAN|nr:DUF3095 domain-containing protein [Tumidithrix elongata RA019]